MFVARSKKEIRNSVRSSTIEKFKYHDFQAKFEVV